MIRVLLAAAALATAIPAAPPREPVVVAFLDAAPPGATGALVTRTARSVPCPSDVWLTLGSGARARLPGNDCPATSDWARIVVANEHRHYGAEPGTLATAVAARGGCVGATGPRAALAAADPSGHVAEYHESLAPSHCGVQLVDGASLADIERVLHPATLLVVVLPHGHHFGTVTLVGEHGVLTGTTGRRGIVTLADLRAYLVDSNSITISPGDLGDLDRREHFKYLYNGWSDAAVIALPLLLAIAFAIRRRVPRPLALAVASVPAAGFLVSVAPWWRASMPGLVVTLGIAVVAALLASLRTEARVAAAIATLLVLDAVTGARLEQWGVASYSMLEGGRFYGVGNVGFGVLATAAVIAAGAAANRWGARAWLLLIPVIAADAAGPWGADFGGAVALTAALVAAYATRARRVVAGIVAGVAVAAGAAAIDYARPANERTHLGRFLADGDRWDTVARKAADAVHSVTGTAWPLLLVGAVLVGVFLMRRFHDRVMLRVLLVLWVVGSLVNDSGVVVAGAGIAVALPLLLSYESSP